MSGGPKLSVSQQIEHLKKKGILFNIVSEEKALEYLTQNNNYFKLRAYRKNYAKNAEDKYVGLEFAYLKDLAIIDMRMRYCLLHMCLDIEHTVRVRIIKTIENSNDDGYSIVANYLATDPAILQEMKKNATRSPYCKDLFQTYENNMPVWVFVELVQFRQLNEFYRYIGKMLNIPQMVKDYYILQEIRQLRNACAHSNCILNDLQSQPNTAHSPNRNMCTALGNIGIKRGVRDRKLSNDRIRQITTILYFYKDFVQSKGLLKYQTGQLHKVFIERMQEHSDYYTTSQAVLTTFEYFAKLVDIWYPASYNNRTEQKP